MGTITYQIPTPGGEQNFTADPKVATALQTLLTLLYGQRDTNNLSPTAAITATQLAHGAGGLLVRAVSASATAADGQLVIVTGGTPLTITLPAPVANGRVGVIAAAGSGASPVTVAAGANVIQSVGLSNASSFPLGTVGSFAMLQSDGTNWYVVAGQQDSGWVALPLSTNWNTNTGPITGIDPAAYRVKGDRVYLRGGIVNNTGSTAFSPTQFATLPAGVRPAKGVYTTANYASGTNAPWTSILATGAISYGDYGNAGLANGFYLILNTSFSLT